MRWKGNSLAQDIENFLAEREQGHPPPNRHEQDSPQWVDAQNRKHTYAKETVSQFVERGLWQRTLDYAELLVIEDARYTFNPSQPGNTHYIRKLAQELRKIGKLKRLVR